MTELAGLDVVEHNGIRVVKGEFGRLSFAKMFYRRLTDTSLNQNRLDSLFWGLSEQLQQLRA